MMPSIDRCTRLFCGILCGLLTFSGVGGASLFGHRSASAADARKMASIVVEPREVTLLGHRDPHLIQVLGATADGFAVDLHGEAQFVSSQPNVVAVTRDGWLKPLAAGTCEITVKVRGETFRVAVTSKVSSSEAPYSFRHEVMAVLTKAGCNMGACHGYSLGKNGFKLSLRGSDPDLDFLAISKESFGRRIDVQHPQASLLVSKPRGEVAHEGGVRFRKGSLSETILLKWVEQGAQGDIADKKQVVAVRLVPDKLVMRPRDKHRLQLIAEYDDGTLRDVTTLGVFNVNNSQFAAVTEDGMVTAEDLGETAIVARFERKFAATGVIVLREQSDFAPTQVPSGHVIDTPVVEKLNRLKIAPSVKTSDEEFLRRVYLDLIGVQPKPDEIREFLANTDASKRDKLVDTLFARGEFVDHWSLKWGDLLQNSRNVVSAPSVYQFREFLRGAVASNLPADEFARRIVTARGGIVDDPASVYFAISKDTNDTVERVTQVFCGVRMLCARCHAHPLENWTQADYYGLASFFNQVSARTDARFSKIPNTKLVQVNLAAGNSTNPRTNKAQPPRYLGGDEPQLDPTADRREAYAKWLTSAENPFFARGLVNRIWSYFFHRGIIEPVDDIRSTNPPINPALLDNLTQDFIAHKFDLRHLMRRIVTSETYQRSSRPNASNKHDEQNFSRGIPRRIPAEALLDTLVQATGVAENIGGAPAGFRAAQLPDANVQSPFLNLFGKPQRMEACECERDNGSNMLQALTLMNGTMISGRLANGNGRAAQLAKQTGDVKTLVTDVYLWTLARHPTNDEVRVCEEFLKNAGAQKAEAIQDLMWALLNSKDFQLSH